MSLRWLTMKAWPTAYSVFAKTFDFPALSLFKKKKQDQQNLDRQDLKQCSGNSKKAQKKLGFTWKFQCSCKVKIMKQYMFAYL